MKIAFLGGELSSRASGLVTLVAGFSEGIRLHGSDVDILTVKGRGFQHRELAAAEPNGVYAEDGLDLARLRWSPKLRKRLLETGGQYDLFHNHTIWSLPSHYGALAARKFGKPLVISSHGALDTWALARSSWKKKVVGFLYQDSDFASAACIHVSAEAEIDNIRRIGLRNPIAVIPNGVEIDDAAIPGEELSQFRERHGIPPKKILLFLARLHEKKGLAHLIPAWADFVKTHPDWQLVIAGPDDGFESATRSLIAEFSLGASVSLVGNMFGREKTVAFRLADAFVLPSHSEGFSLAILEALSFALPVLITPGCNFPEVHEARAGIEISPDRKSVADGLAILASMSAAEMDRMGANGRELVRKHYSWKSVSARMLELYEWCRTGDKPSGFELVRSLA